MIGRTLLDVIENITIVIVFSFMNYDDCNIFSGGCVETNGVLTL